MRKKSTWLIAIVLASGLVVGLPCVQATEPNAPECVKATSPTPADGATDVFRDGTVLKWTGSGADEYDVYLGTSADAVAQADQATVGDVAVSLGQKGATFNPGRLALSQTYYWRVDQVKLDPADPNAVTICKGDVWSFTVEPATLPISNVKATAACSIYENMGPEKTVDGSGLTRDEHSIDMTAMWLSCLSTPDPNDPNAEINWIQYEFDKAYKLDEMWVWNWNSGVEKIFGLGVKDALVKYSTNGTDWTVLGDVRFARAPGAAGYKYDTVVDLGGIVAKFVRIVIKSSHNGYREYGLSEVKFFYVPVFPTEPKPAPGTKGVPLDGVLSWRSGREAASHKVYIGTDKQAVTKGTVSPRTSSTNSLKLAPLNLELDKTYYWRVEEVNDAETPKAWTGDIWSFSTIDYLVVENFESYKDKLGDVWWDFWKAKGYALGGGSSGSAALNKSIVHGGNQAMSLTYNNSNSPFQIELRRDITSQKDWTVKGVKKLVIFFHGDTLNSAEPFYVRLNGSKVVYSGSIRNPWWGFWSIDLKSFGMDLKDIQWMTIGVGPYARSKGKVYIDDIRLYQKTPSIPTLVDMALKLNSEGATKGQFDTFLAAMLLADPKILESLSSEEPYTVFAPTDDACAAVGIGIKEVAAMDRAVLNDIVRYHIAAGKVAADNTGKVTTLEGGFLVQDANVVTDDIGGQAVIKATAEASNGLIHMVDAVLMPFNMGKNVDVLKALNSAGDLAGQFDTLVAALDAAKPAVRDALGKRFSTLFAPTDDAFAALGLDPNTVVKVNQSVLTDILLYHVVDSRLMGADILAATEIKTAQGGVLTQKDGTLTDSIGGTATITGLDVETSNGVIHILDAVVMPFAQTRLYDVVTLVGGLNEVGDLAGMFDTLIAAAQAADPSVLATVSGSGSFTVFAPTDEAFAALGWDAATIADVNQVFLTDVLKYHIAAGTLLKKDIVAAGKVKTLQGGELVVDPNTAALTSALGGQAAIAVADILASNGAIQVIDAVLLPYEQPKAVVDPNAPAVMPAP